nr:hypothetical protein [Angustibacter aerolatus]
MIDPTVASTFADLAAVVNARPGAETVQQAIVDTARQPGARLRPRQPGARAPRPVRDGRGDRRRRADGRRPRAGDPRGAVHRRHPRPRLPA